MKKWESIAQGNMVLERKGYYISYNPAVGAGPSAEANAINDVAVMGGSLLGMSGIRNPEETALVIEHKDAPRKFKILNGDWRIEYEKCKTLAECLTIYRKNIQNQSEWSTDAPLPN